MSQLVVSVPCASCSEPIRFGEDRCASCSVEVSRDLRDALHARLEASDADYRELMRHTRGAATVLDILGGFHLLLALVVVVLGGADGPAMTAMALLYGAVGILFLVIGGLAKRQVLVAMLSGIALWFAYNAWLVAIDPSNLISALFLKVVSFTLLARGAVAANSARLTLKQMSSTVRERPGE